VHVLRAEEAYYASYIRSILTGVQTLEKENTPVLPSCDEYRQWKYNRARDSINIERPLRPNEVRYLDENGNCYGIAHHNNDEVSNFSDLADIEAELETRGFDEVAHLNDEIIDTPNVETELEAVGTLETVGNLTEIEMRKYILNSKSCRVNILRDFLYSRGINCRTFKKKRLVQTISELTQMDSENTME
jgi:hypothetical protein